MALADLLTSCSDDLPGEVSQVLSVLRRRPNTALSLPTRVKVSTYKHLLTNDRHAVQADGCRRPSTEDGIGGT